MFVQTFLPCCFWSQRIYYWLQICIKDPKNFIHLKLTLSITAFEQGGCFEETNPRLLPGQAGKWAAWMKGEDGKPNNSPAACKKFCEGFKYYGVQARNQCFCGNKLHGALKKMPESQCRDVCPGDATQKMRCRGKNEPV